MGLCSGLLLLWLCGLLYAFNGHGHGPVEDYGILNEEIVIFFPENKSGKCVFPFYYNKDVFYDCVSIRSKHKWCSLTETFKGHWKYCSEEDMADCVFPFWYRRMVYWECTSDSETFGKKWCSLTQNYNKHRIWKYCDP